MNLFQFNVKYIEVIIIYCTGGPTAETRDALNFSIQYWTSRGWAFVDVNYGGSTGISVVDLYLFYLFIYCCSVLSQYNDAYFES